MLGKIKGPQSENQNKSNTASCAVRENLIKSKSTFKSVNFGVWIQNVHQYYLCGWLLRDMQHFQNPCVSFICMFGTLSSVATVLSSGIFFFPVWLSISAYWVSQNLDFWLSVPAFLFLLFQRQIFISSQFFKHLEKTRKPIKQEAKCLIWRVLRARSIYFKPFIYAAFMIYA